MGTLATMLKEKGFDVAGSDQNLYPPMSTHLEALGIPVCQGYSADNPGKYNPDVFIIGNAIRRTNPEAQYVLNHGAPYLSMPEAIARFFLAGRKSIVVAGTHGKSTTSSLLAWTLSEGKMDPTAFIGAFLRNWQRSYRIGDGPYMVIEGDEYDTAFFDKGPKFLHYSPAIGILTSIEYDHADIFPDFEAVLNAFRSYVRLIPADGHLIVNADDPNCTALSHECKGRTISYGWSETADWKVTGLEYLPGELRFLYRNPDSKRVESMVSRIPGRHNVGNTLAVMAAASIAGMTMEQIQSSLISFRGLKRRQEVIGESNGILVMEDFAHHPTAVRETLGAIRLFYPGRRIIAAFEPRTNSSRRSVFQDAYVSAFDEADCVCVKEPPGMDAIPEGERLNTAKLVEDIGKRVARSYFFPATDDLLRFLLDRCVSGDLVLCMSNGSFDGLPQRLFQSLLDRAPKGDV